MIREPQRQLPHIEQPSGFPSPANEYREIALDLNLLIIKHPAATFTIRFRGHHGAVYNINDGDLLVVDQAVHPLPGQLIIGERDGERIITRMQRDERMRVVGAVLWVLKPV